MSKSESCCMLGKYRNLHFEISSSREFEFELRTYEPLICNPELFSSEDHWRLRELDPLLAEGDTAWRQRHRSKFQKFQLENLVDFEKCCKTHIFLQKSEPIQPKTSNILPKFCQPTLSDSVSPPWTASRSPPRRRGSRSTPHRSRPSTSPPFFRR